MPSVGDLIKITSCSKIFSQDACNTFYFLVAVWTGAIEIEDFLAVFQDLVLDPIAPQLSTALVPNFLEWRSLDNPAEIVTIPGGFDGADGATTAVASFAAVSVRLFGETAVTRSGWKRIPGLTEDGLISGALNPGTLTAFQNWADDSLQLPVMAPAGTGADATLIPVIVGRNPDGSYNLSAVNPVASAVVQSNLTTQNTRKIGRGG